MPEHATSSYTIGKHNITVDITSDIVFTTRNLCGAIDSSNFRNSNGPQILSEPITSLQHKITCAFVNGNCTIEEREEDWLILTIHLYDNVRLDVDLRCGIC